MGSLFAWGPKGSFAIQQDCGLIFTDPAGLTHQITNGWGFTVAISPRGDRIAYVDNGRFGEDVVHIVSTRTGRELGTIENASSVAWAPGGRRFAFVKNPDNSGPGFGAIAVADANGQHVRTVIRASRPEPHFGLPTWSPDGRFIAFQRGFRTIGIVRPTGAGRRYIVHHWPGIELQGWSPDSRRIYYDGVFS
jgi:Tol biopolymer transport system component